MKLQCQRDQCAWSAPEYLKVSSITVVEHGRLPGDEAVVKNIMATISAGNMSVLPPIHLWRKQPGGDPLLVAGRNRLEAHKRCNCEVISARVITGETPEIVRAVQLTEIDENLNRRELSPALRQLLIKRRKALYAEEHPETKRGSAGGRAKAGKSAQSQNATEQTPAFIDAHAKQTGRHRATIAREIREAERIGDDVMKSIVGTSLDRKSEIAALAAMDEHERQAIVDRAVAGEKVSAAKTRGAAKRSGSDYNHRDPAAEDHETGAVIPDTEQPQADDRDVAGAEAYARWLARYEAVKAKQAALAQELEKLYPLFEAKIVDLLYRIEDVDVEARRVNDAKPLGAGRMLGNTESVARAGGLSIMKDLKLPAWEGNSSLAWPPRSLYPLEIAASMGSRSVAEALDYAREALRRERRAAEQRARGIAETRDEGRRGGG